MGLGTPPLKSKILLESSPPKSVILVRRLALTPPPPPEASFRQVPSGHVLSCSSHPNHDGFKDQKYPSYFHSCLSSNIYIYIYIYIYIHVPSHIPRQVRQQGSGGLRVPELGARIATPHPHYRAPYRAPCVTYVEGSVRPISMHRPRTYVVPGP